MRCVETARPLTAPKWPIVSEANVEEVVCRIRHAADGCDKHRMIQGRGCLLAIASAWRSLAFEVSEVHMCMVAWWEDRDSRAPQVNWEALNADGFEFRDSTELTFHPESPDLTSQHRATTAAVRVEM